MSYTQARSQDLEKGGELFWKSEKCANDLDWNFHWSRSSFRRFVWKLRRNFSESSEIQRFFPPKIRWSPKKKKGLHRYRDWFFVQFRKFSRLRGAVFEWGGLFSIFLTKSASKAQKTCDFAYFTSQWGGLEPPPPLATLLVTPHVCHNSLPIKYSSFCCKNTKSRQLG